MRWENGVPLLQGMTSYWMLRQWDWRREQPQLTVERIEWLLYTGAIHQGHAHELVKGRSLAEVLTLRTVVPELAGVTLH